MSENNSKKPSKGLFSQFSTPPKGTRSEYKSTRDKREKERLEKLEKEKAKKELDERRKQQRLLAFKKESEQRKHLLLSRRSKDPEELKRTKDQQQKRKAKSDRESLTHSKRVASVQSAKRVKSPSLTDKSTQKPSVSAAETEGPLKGDLSPSVETLIEDFETLAAEARAQSLPSSPRHFRDSTNSFSLPVSPYLSTASLTQISPVPSISILSPQQLDSVIDSEAAYAAEPLRFVKTEPEPDIKDPLTPVRLNLDAYKALAAQVHKIEQGALKGQALEQKATSAHKSEAAAAVQAASNSATKVEVAAGFIPAAVAVAAGPTPVTAASKDRKEEEEARERYRRRREQILHRKKMAERATAFTNLLEFKVQQADAQKAAARTIITGPKPYNISKLKSLITYYKQIATDIRKTSDNSLLHCLENYVAGIDAAKDSRNAFETADEAFLEQVEAFKLRNEPEFGEKKRAKLPDLPFDSFAGDVLKYPSFKQTWDSMFGNRLDLEDVEKLRYLLKNMKPGSEAHRALENLPVVHDSYQQALETLESRFGKKDVVIACFQKQMESLPVARYVANELRRTYDLLKHCFKTLQEYEAQPTDPFIINRWLEKFPPEAIRAWIKHKATLAAADITPQAFLTWLETFVQSEETIALTKQISNLGSQTPPTKPPSNNKKDKDQSKGKEKTQPQEPDVHEQIFATGAKNNKGKNNGKTEKDTRKKERACINCQSSQHHATDCPAFKKLSIEQRWTVAKDRKACFICLIPGHRTRQCYKKKTCPKCKSYHCELLHTDKKPLNK